MLPIPVTAFLPLVLFPLFNVVPAKVVAEVCNSTNSFSFPPALLLTSFFLSVLVPVLCWCPHVRQAYINDTLFILIGSFIVALAMERWGLHTRVALRVINPIHPSVVTD